jgi:hypothetical protein
MASQMKPLKLQESLSLCVEHDIPRCEWLPVAAILMKLCLVAEFNKKVINCPKISYKMCLVAKNVPLGSGLYLASSLLNHSCDPNMYPVFYGTSIVFRARRPIVKGEQLTCSYLEPALPAVYIDRGQRQKALMEFHKFKCW